MYIFKENENIFFADNIFQNNTSIFGDGGAIIVYQSNVIMNLFNCTFQNNVAASGGAVSIYSDNSNVYFYECKFVSNLAKERGLFNFVILFSILFIFFNRWSYFYSIFKPVYQFL